MFPVAVLLGILQWSFVVGYVAIAPHQNQIAYRIQLEAGDEIMLCGRMQWMETALEISLSDEPAWIKNVTSSVKCFLNDNFRYLRALKENYEKKRVFEDGEYWLKNEKFCVLVEAYKIGKHPYVPLAYNGFTKTGILFSYPFAQGFIRETRDYVRFNEHYHKLKYLMVQGAKSVVATLNGNPMKRVSTISTHRKSLSISRKHGPHGGTVVFEYGSTKAASGNQFPGDATRAIENGLPFQNHLAAFPPPFEESSFATGGIGVVKWRGGAEEVPKKRCTYPLERRGGGWPLEYPLTMCFRNIGLGKNDYKARKFFIRILPADFELWDTIVYLLVTLDVTNRRYYADFTIGNTSVYSSATLESEGGQQQIDIHYEYSEKFCVVLEIKNSMIRTNIGLADSMRRLPDLPVTEYEHIKYLQIDGIPREDIVVIKDYRGFLRPLPYMPKQEYLVYRLDDRDGLALRDPVDMCFWNMGRQKEKITILIMSEFPTAYERIIFLMVKLDVQNSRYYADFFVGNTGKFSADTKAEDGGGRQTDIWYDYQNVFCMTFTIADTKLHVDMGEPLKMTGDPDYPSNEVLPYKYLKIEGIPEANIMHIRDGKGILVPIPITQKFKDYDEPV